MVQFGKNSPERFEKNFKNRWKWRKMSSLIADKWIDIIKPDSASSRVAGRFFNDDYSQYEDTFGSGDYSLYSGWQKSRSDLLVFF